MPLFPLPLTQGSFWKLTMVNRERTGKKTGLYQRNFPKNYYKYHLHLFSSSVLLFAPSTVTGGGDCLNGAEAVTGGGGGGAEKRFGAALLLWPRAGMTFFLRRSFSLRRREGACCCCCCSTWERTKMILLNFLYKGNYSFEIMPGLLRVRRGC